MSILTHNLFRLLALSLDRYKHLTDIKIYEKFLDNSADVDIVEDRILISLKKKRNLPAILENLNNIPEQKFQWLNNLKVSFSGAAYS